MVKKDPVPIRFPPDKKHADLFARVVAVAKQFPGIEESRSYGTPAIKVKKKFMARLRSEAEGGLVILCDFVDREMLLAAAPEVFYITDHYTNSRAILINLEAVDWNAMPAIVEQAWRMAATAKLIRAYDER